MQVMDTREFEQDHVLIGQKGAVGKATVTNDPILMSMLSTGLYANPLKSMVQEVTFNAWDAHRMGKCLDKPIDIYFNDTTGLIIRDYGPGIPPGETFTNIYFTYGGSTKRDDADATGGFGLGSKSPFAYTDNFNVTSHHDGKKYMYIMHRVHDENDGGPGYTPIIQGAPTTEQGLMVSVPFKNENDKLTAYHYLKEILYLSGIKANIHYDGTRHRNSEIPDVELVQAEALKPTEFVSREENPHGDLYAVYGGVSYLIPAKQEYQEEYSFLKKISNLLGDIYIGFAPNTLTPLPTREGLNMSERSIESITSALETIQEHYVQLLIPATKIMFLETLTTAKASGIQPHFIRRKWADVGTDRSLSDMVETRDCIERAITRRGPTQNEASWNSLCRLLYSNTSTVMRMIGVSKLNTMLGLTWAKVYPEHMNWRHSFTPKSKAPQLALLATEGVSRQWKQDFIQLWKDLSTVTDQSLDPRLNSGGYSSRWELITNIRAAGGYGHIHHSRKLNIIKRMDKENRLKVPTQPSFDGLWWKKDGVPVHSMMMFKTIIVAKTLKALNDTNFNRAIQLAMVPTSIPTRPDGTYYATNWGSWIGRGNTYPIPAFVIHKKKNGYDNAIQWLKDQGYTVLEADEPEERVTPVRKTEIEATEPEPPKPVGFPKVCTYMDDWEDTTHYIQKPSTYVYVTKTQIKSYYDYPNTDVVKLVQRYCPNMVVVHNKKHADKLDKAGAYSLFERVDQILEKILSDKEKLTKLYLHHFLAQHSELPRSLLEMPQMQKLMGIPYVRTKESPNFFRDLDFLRFLTNKHRYSDGHDVPPDVRQKATKALEEVKNSDSLVLVRKMNKAASIFHETSLERHVAEMSRGEKKIFIEKLARFLRTV